MTHQNFWMWGDQRLVASPPVNLLYHVILSLILAAAMFVLIRWAYVLSRSSPHLIDQAGDGSANGSNPVRSGEPNEILELFRSVWLTESPGRESGRSFLVSRCRERLTRVSWPSMRFSGSRERDRGPKATVGVATGPRKTAPELSDSLFNTP